MLRESSQTKYISFLWVISGNLTGPQGDATMNVSARNHSGARVLAGNRTLSDRVAGIPDEWNSSPQRAQNAENRAKSPSDQPATGRSIAASVLAAIKMALCHNRIVFRKIFDRAKRALRLLSGLKSKSKTSASMASKRNSRS